jgi:hypothetical protein
MQIVIDLPEIYYKQIMDAYNGDQRRRLNQIGLVIAKGIPIPKGHGPLKDENELLKHEVFVRIGEDYEEYAVPTECFAEVPAIIEADEG